MSNDLMERQVEYIAESGAEVKLSPAIIKNYLVKGQSDKVTNQELILFLKLCENQKLNPFLNEAYLVKFGTNAATMVVGKEVFTKRARRNPNCKGWKAGTIVLSKEGEVIYRNGEFKLPTETLVGGWAEVYIADGETIRNEVSFEEYNKGQSSWKSMPCTMIRKTALCHALREAFPEDLGGLYGTEEMVESPNIQQAIEIQQSSLETEFKQLGSVESATA